MKKIVVLTSLIIFSQIGLAGQAEVLQRDMKTNEYISSVSGKEGCLMPKEKGRVGLGECRVVMDSVETGWTLSKKNNECFLDKVEVINWKNFKKHNINGYVPQMRANRTPTPCP